MQCRHLLLQRLQKKAPSKTTLLLPAGASFSGKGQHGKVLRASKPAQRFTILFERIEPLFMPHHAGHKALFAQRPLPSIITAIWRRDIGVGQYGLRAAFMRMAPAA